MKKREAGVGIIIKVDKNIEINDPNFTDPRTMGIDIKINGFNLRVVNAYSLTETHGTDEQKRQFYANLKKAIAKTEKHQKLVIGGDFNTTTSIGRYKSNFDGKKILNDPDFNDNGSRLKLFCMTHKLSILSTFFKHRLLHRNTWYSNDKRTKKVIDYILAEKYVQQFTTDCKVYLGFEVETDHRLLKTTINALATKKARRRYCKNPTPPKRNYNIKALQIPEIQKSFVEALDDPIKQGSVNITEINNLSETLVTTLNETAMQVLPPKTKRGKGDELRKKDKLLNDLLDQRSRLSRTSDEYKKLSKKVKKRVHYIRNLKIRNEAMQINYHATRRETEELFRNMKWESSSFKSIRRNNKCESVKLKNPFEKHFNPPMPKDEPHELHQIPEYMKHLQLIATDSINVHIPDKDKIKKALLKLKNGKAANHIPPEFLKYASESESLLCELERMLTTIWRTQSTPASWSHTKLVALWKGAAKGNVKDPSAYRGLQVGSTLCKLTITIILDRLKKWYDEQLLDQQQGFRSGRGTADGIFITKRI